LHDILSSAVRTGLVEARGASAYNSLGSYSPIGVAMYQK
jgi:hypothetical protein